MFEKLCRKIRNKKGFTLIELIVVIAVLGILAGIAVPRLAGVQKNAKIGTDFANAKMIANAAEIALAQGDITTSSDSAAIKAALIDASKGYLQSWPVPKLYESGAFIVEIENGVIKVSVDTNGATTGGEEIEVYPDKASYDGE